MRVRLVSATKFRLTVTLMAAFALVMQPVYSLLVADVARAGSGSIKNVQSGEIFTDFTTAINDTETAGGHTLRATGNFTVDASVAVNKSLTITTPSSSVITTSSTTNVFAVTASNVKINGFTFKKINTAGDFRFISLLTSATGAQIWNNSFSSLFNIGDSYTVRGLVVSPGVTGYDIRGNNFSHVRQPAYIDGSTGTVRGNYTEHSKGWVVTSGSNVTFANNTWGTGANLNVLDIAIIPEAVNNYPDSKVVQMSHNNHDAVVENQFGGTKVLSDAFVQPVANGRTGDEGSAWNPYTKVQNGLYRIVEGGTVRVANGSYTEAFVVKKSGTKLVGESRDGVKLTPVSNQYGQGLSVEGLNNVDLRNFTINAAAGGGGYALKAHNASKLTLANVTLNGAGSAVNMGGVDINGVNGVTISDVISRNFKKNGFAFTSRFALTDPFTRNVLLSNVTAQGNGWAGIAFYTTNSAGTVGHSIPGVTFAGVNTISGNTKGLEVVGDSDSNINGSVTPRYVLKDVAGNPVNLGAVNFTDNSLHIVNNQTASMNATNVRFDGKLHAAMTSAERVALQVQLFDKADRSFLGQVVFDDTTAPSIPTGGAPHEAYTTTNDFYFTWNESTDDNAGNVSYEFRSSQNLGQVGAAPDGSGAWESGVLADPTIHSTGAPDGIWYWQVRAIDEAGNKSAWSAVWKMAIDTVNPGLTVTTPLNGEVFGGTGKEEIVVTSQLSDAQGLGQYYIDIDGSAVPTTMGDDNDPTIISSPVSLTVIAKFKAADFSNGEHTINVRATDKAGNTTLESRTIWVNNNTVTVPGGSGSTDPDLEETAGNPTQSLLDQVARLSRPFVVPTVFGAATTPQAADADKEVLGAKETSDVTSGAQTIAAAPTEEGWKIFGTAWYWWVLLAAILGVSTAWLMRRAKQRAAQNNL